MGEEKDEIEKPDYGRVVNEEGRQLPDDIRYMAVLAALIGCRAWMSTVSLSRRR